MFVHHRMSSPPVTITPDTPFQDALKLMRDHQFRRLPVVNKKGKLVGIVSERDLLHAAPSPATSLSIWELHYLLSKIQVQKIMTKDVITTAPGTPIEKAARLMVANKIGGLPVVDEQGDVVGVITETDIFTIKERRPLWQPEFLFHWMVRLWPSRRFPAPGHWGGDCRPSLCFSTPFPFYQRFKNI